MSHQKSDSNGRDQGESVVDELKTKVQGGPPTPGSPPPPGGFVPLTPVEIKRNRKPLATQILNALRAAEEIEKGTFAKDFGEGSPDPKELALALRLLAAWFQEKEHTLAWLQFVTSGCSQVGDSTLRTTKGFRPLMDLVLDRKPGLKDAYPALVAFVHGRSVLASQGAATKAAEHKAADAQPEVPTPDVQKKTA